MSDALDLTIQIIEGSGGFGADTAHSELPRRRRGRPARTCTRQDLNHAVHRANELLQSRNLSYRFHLEDHDDGLVLVLSEQSSSDPAATRHLERMLDPRRWAAVVQALDRLDGMFLDCHM